MKTIKRVIPIIVGIIIFAAAISCGNSNDNNRYESDLTDYDFKNKPYSDLTPEQQRQANQRIRQQLEDAGIEVTDRK